MGNSLLSFTITSFSTFSLPNDILSLNAKKNNKYPMEHKRVCWFPRERKAKQNQESCPRNVLFIFHNKHTSSISYHHHLNIMSVC